MKRNSIFLTIAGMAICGTTLAQTTASHTVGIIVPSVIMVGLHGGTNVDLTFAAPSTPGSPIASTATDQSLYLNYSYIKTSAQPTVKVQAKISSAIEGFTITVNPQAATGGGGKIGTASPVPITLATGDLDIISDIGSSYTGGTNGGHNLLYSASFSTYADLVTNLVNPPSLNVTYTITSN